MRRYLWLQNDDAAVADWVAMQNARTAEHLTPLPQLDGFRDVLTEVLGAEVRQLPVVRGNRRFQLRRGANDQQFSLWVSDETGDRILIDAATIGSPQDSITEFCPSPDGLTVAWAMSSGGADWMVGRFRNVLTGHDSDDSLHGIKWPAFAWLDDERVAYMSWGQPVEGQELLARNDDASVRLHVLGQPQREDVEIYRPDSAAWSIPAVSEDRKWITVQVNDGTTPAHVYRQPTTLPGEWETVVTGDGPDGVITVYGDETLVLSFSANPAGSILAYATGGHRRVVYEAPQDSSIADAQVIGDHLVVLSHPLEGSLLRIQPLTAVGSASSPVEIPIALGSTVRDFGGGRDGATVLIDIEHTGGARRVVELPIATDRETLAQALATDAAEYVTTLVEVPSKDGTLVPMRIVHVAGFVPDGSAKVFLSVYGGYGVPYLAVGYDDWHLAWLRAGGVLAYAGVRGGSERGEDWHTAATRHQKQNGVDDLVSCIVWFENNGWSTPRSVAVNGMSNGGMMVSIALTQSPELIGAAIPEVPVADMLNFHRYTVGHGWIREFGDPDIAEDRAVLAAYSPLHNVRPDVSYPPTLVITADKDDRVPPGPHAYKLAAALMDVPAARDEVFLRVEADAGHAIGRSLQAKVDERGAVLAFAAAALGL
ncbi:prolyl oligopeptidase family serine peptidase [Microbacterium sp. 2216-1]|uniref:prolyl oligopeptidase family serine peptidase n=1 Tax=Microbacterium sp. 2216-1 TaxID=3390053 RepID=UPI0039769FE8